MAWTGSAFGAQVHKLGLANRGVGHSHTPHDGARVVRIFDGDCFSFRQGDRIGYVRLWGIDAPECAQAGGKAARTALNVLLRDSRLVIRAVAKDRFGRIVGRVGTKDFEDVGLEMIRMGHAWYWPRYAPNVVSYRDAELDAKTHKRGLWAVSHPLEPWEWRRLHNSLNPSVTEST